MNETTRNHSQSRIKTSVYLFACLALASLLIAYFITFGTRGVFLSKLDADHITLKWGIAHVLQYGLVIMRNTALIWLLMPLMQKRLAASEAIHFWQLAFSGGLAILAMIAFTNINPGASVIYGQFMMVTWGHLSIVSAIIAIIIAQPFLLKFIKSDEARWLTIGLLCLPLIFNRDLFLFNINDQAMSITAVIVLAILAGFTENLNLRKNSKILFLPLMGIISLYLMAVIEVKGGISLTNANRFIGPMSPLSLLPAMWLAKLLTTWNPKTKNSTRFSKTTRFSLLFIAIFMGTTNYRDLSSRIYSAIANTFKTWGIWWLVSATLIFLVSSYLVAMLAQLARKSHLWHFANHYTNLSRIEIIRRLRNWRQTITVIWQNFWRSVVAAATMLIVQIGTTLMVNQSSTVIDNVWNADEDLNIFSFIFTQTFTRQLMGAVVLLALYWLLLSITNRYWISLLSVSTFAIIFAFANRIKINLRSEPIMVADLAEIRQLPELIKMINPMAVVLVIILIIAIILTLFLIERRAQNAGQAISTRLLKLLIAGSFIVSLGFLNHSYSPTRQIMNAMYVSTSNNNPSRYAKWFGPTLQFISGLDIKIMAEPENYSAKTIKHLVRKYRKRAREINQARSNQLKDTTVVFNLSESFADPSRLDGVDFNADPIPNIRKLMTQTTSGTMLSFGYGGGTANMEYMSLTGMSLGSFDTGMNTPYTQLVPQLKQAPNISNFFNYASAIHPYTGGFYNRIGAYRKFGFDKFAYLGSKYQIYDQKRLGNSPYLSDQTAYANALRQINSQKDGQFINLISMQNHGSYKNWYQRNQFRLDSQKGVGNVEELETYTQGLHYTDLAAQDFKDKIDKINKPIIWVFYGDHLPALYDSFSNKLAQFETDYFVYANKYAREHKDALTKISKKTTYTSASDFIALAIDQAQAKVTPYTALLTEIREQLPTQWEKQDNDLNDSTIGLTFVTEKGKKINYEKLSKKQKTLYQEYQLILYDINVGQQYSLKDGFIE